MIHWKIEGVPCRDGINVYRLSDPSSAGFVIKVAGRIFSFRWSKRAKRFFMRSM